MNKEIIEKKISFFKNTELDELEEYRKFNSYGFIDFHRNLILPNLLNSNFSNNKFLRNTRYFLIENTNLHIKENVFNLIFSIIYYEGIIFDNMIKNIIINNGFLNKAFILNTIFDSCSFSANTFFKNEFHNCKFYNCNFNLSIFKDNIFFGCIFNNCDFEKTQWGGEQQELTNNICFKNNCKNTMCFSCSFLSAIGVGEAVFFDNVTNIKLNVDNTTWNAFDISKNKKQEIVIKQEKL